MKDEVRLARALTNYGAFLYRTGRATEAVVHLEKADKIFPNFFPPGHPEIKKTAMHLAVARKKATG